MKLVVQRVSEASVDIDGKCTGSIARGLCVLVGIRTDDTTDDVDWLAGKLMKMRIFPDNDGVMNLSLLDIGGELLVVSQFTLYALTARGNRPSYIRAAAPEVAVPLYERFIAALDREIAPSGHKVQTGVFGADMQVSLVNDGPVTIVIDSKNRE